MQEDVDRYEGNDFGNDILPEREPTLRPVRNSKASEKFKDYDMTG